MLWRRFTNAIVEKVLQIQDSARIKVQSASGALTTITPTELATLSGLTASAAELNINDGLTATTAELNRTADASARVVTTTATALNLTLTEHGERVVLINTNSTVANTFTLPVATGSGVKMTLVNNITQTQGSVVVAANGTTDTLKGKAYIVSSTEEAAICAFTSASSDKITMNRTTTGGLGGDMVEAWDVAANVWLVNVTLNGNGSVATPFSET